MDGAAVGGHQNDTDGVRLAQDIGHLGRLKGRIDGDQGQTGQGGSILEQHPLGAGPPHQRGQGGGRAGEGEGAGD